MPRTLLRAPPGTTSSTSPTLTSPATGMPVRTVPKPRTVKTRWIGRRKTPSAGRGSVAEAIVARWARSSSTPLAGHAGDPQDRRVLEEGAPGEVADVLGGELHQVLVHEVDLVQGHETALHAEELHDLQVLARLGHHAVVGGDHQHDQVDPARPGGHVADEALVPGHVDDPYAPSIREREVREAQVDREAALLLLLEAIRVDPGQRADQGRLAVVDVSGGADHDGLDLEAHGGEELLSGRRTRRAKSGARTGL